MSTRRSFSGSCALLAVWCATGVPAGAESRAANVDNKTYGAGAGVYLVLDDYHIAHRANVIRKVHPATKLQEPVIVSDQAWEDLRLYTMGTIAFDPESERFQLWYLAHVRDEGPKDPRLTRSRGDLVLYATSRDGIAWEKPALGIYTWNDCGENNIVYDFHSPSIVVGEDEQGRRRFWMAGHGKRGRPGGYVTATSDDGFHWEFVGQVASGGFSDNITLTRDPLSGRFMAYQRVPFRLDGRGRRAVGVSYSDDFLEWTEPELVFGPDKDDDAAWITDDAPQHTCFYNMTVNPYGDVFLGFVTVCHFEKSRLPPGPFQSGTDGPVYVELVYSRDGRNWQRLDGRPAVIEPGPEGSWDGGMILGVTNLLDVAKETWLYYTGFNVTHGGPMPPKESAIGRAHWKRGRFVSLDAHGRQAGVVETVPLKGYGQTLFVNADASGGSIAVELIDADGNPLPGYAASDHQAIVGDRLDQRVEWNDGATIEIDEATPFAIRFILHDASLYSFRFAGQ